MVVSLVKYYLHSFKNDKYPLIDENYFGKEITDSMNTLIISM